MSVVRATILSSGKTMDPAFELVSLDIVKEANRVPYASLTLLDGSAAKQTFAISDDAFFEPGKQIEIKLGYEGEPGSEATVFKGLVVKQVVEANPQGTTLSVELKDAALKMTQVRRSAVYTQQSDSQLFAKLIGDHGLQKGTLASTQPTYPEIVQYYCSDWDFILSRADVHGALVIAEDGKISIGPVSFQAAAKHKFEFGISEIYEFEIEVDGSQQVQSIQSAGWDPKNQKMTPASKASPFNLAQGNLKAQKVAGDIGGNAQNLTSAVALDTKLLKAWADGAMVKNRLAMLRGTISVPGNASIRRMDVIEVKGVGKRFDGKTVVTGVRQRVNLNGWRTDVQFGLSPERHMTKADVMDRPAAGLLPGVNGLQIGVVNSLDDPDKGFRVKVQLPAIDEKSGAVWARMAVPDAGNARGFLFLPEVGDEVIVGFLNDDPGQAVILGSLYSAKNKPPSGLDKRTSKNVTKGIVTRSGITLTFSDDDKPKVFLQTPAANKITLDDDGQLIEIKDQHGNAITMSKDGITLKSAKDFKIDASGNVEIKGAKVDVK